MMSVIEAPTIETLNERNKIMQHHIKLLNAAAKDFKKKKGQFEKLVREASPFSED